MEKHLVTFKGEDFSQRIFLVDNNGDAFDLTGITIASAKLSKSYYSSTKSNFDITLVGSTSGEIELGLTSGLTSSLDATQYVYDVKVLNPSGDYKIVLKGTIRINPSVSG